jgi:hypothetical protein
MRTTIERINAQAMNWESGSKAARTERDSAEKEDCEGPG